jgi:hypothetical protein
MKLFRDKNAEEMVWNAYKVIEILGGDIEILSCFGSFRDTLPDDDCLYFTDEWIKNHQITPKRNK